MPPDYDSDDLLGDETLDVGAAASHQRARPQGGRAVRITVVSGPDRGSTLLLPTPGGEAVLGSGAGADLLLRDRAVSRRHLRVTCQPDGVLISDLGARNGTFHGGARVGSLVLPLHGSARLRLGPDTEVELAPERGPGEVAPAPDRFAGLVGRSPAMRQLFRVIESAAGSDASVLLHGETGTGKEALAEAVHRLSQRRDGPLVVVDCGTLARDLAGSELFGHMRGAFTGATQDRRGLIEAAHRGTLFLDEIGELPVELQPHLLRVLEKREIRPIGGTRSRKVDIRVIAATHRDLRQRITEGHFREDLYFRLAVVEATVPPLRDRTEDIPLLLEHFLLSQSRPDFQVSPALMTRLLSYSWPGNVRELRNVVQRCVSLRDQPEALSWPGAPPDAAALDEGDGDGLGDATSRDGLGEPAGPGALGLPFKEAKARLVEAFERDYLVQLLQRHQGNVSRAAQEAGIDRNHIHRLIKRYRLPARP